MTWLHQHVQSTYSKRHGNSKTEHSKNYSYGTSHDGTLVPSTQFIVAKASTIGRLLSLIMPISG
jgi:hypothetical protein